MNTVNLTGRLVADPDIKTSEKNGKEMVIANFTLAVNRKYKTDGQSADFIRCVAFYKTAEILRDFFTKGMKADVVGEIRTSSVEKDGQRQYFTNVVVNNLEFGESKSAFEKNGTPQAKPEPTPSGNDEFLKVDDVSDEGLPFNL